MKIYKRDFPAIIGWRSAFNEVINLGPLLTEVKALVLEKAVAMRAMESFMVRVYI